MFLAVAAGRVFFCCWLGVLPHLQTIANPMYV